MRSPDTEQSAAITIQRFVRGWLVRKKHSDFFRKIKYRKFIIKEIMNFEQTYINKLNMLIQHLKIPLMDNHYRSLISVERVGQLFSNIDEILELHKKILATFTNSLPPYLIGKIYSEMLPLFSIYFPYVKNYNTAFKIYSALVEDEEFSSLIEIFGYLPSYLILPIQQTPRYVLLFSDLLKHTNPQNSDYDNIKLLIDKVKETAKSINECITSNDNDDDDIILLNGSNTNNNKNNNNAMNQPKRPASASSKRKPRNNISMHKKAIDAVLSSENTSTNTDYSHLPSYLRPTQASNGWSRQKVELSPVPKWRGGGTVGNADQLYATTYSLASTPYVPNNNNQLFIDRSPSRNLPPWRPTSPSPRSINYTKLTKRPMSPPPKPPNFYNLDSGNNASGSNSPSAIVGNSHSNIGNGSSSSPNSSSYISNNLKDQLNDTLSLSGSSTPSFTNSPTLSSSSSVGGGSSTTNYSDGVFKIPISKAKPPLGNIDSNNSTPPISPVSVHDRPQHTITKSLSFSASTSETTTN